MKNLGKWKFYLNLGFKPLSYSEYLLKLILNFLIGIFLLKRDLNVTLWITTTFSGPKGGRNTSSTVFDFEIDSLKKLSKK